MIIKTWLVLDEAHEAGKQFEFYCNLDLVWQTGDLAECNYEYIKRMLDEGWIRTKPETVTLYEYKSADHVFWHHSSKYAWNTAKTTGRVINNGVIEEK